MVMVELICDIWKITDMETVFASLSWELLVNHLPKVLSGKSEYLKNKEHAGKGNQEFHKDFRF